MLKTFYGCNLGTYVISLYLPQADLSSIVYASKVGAQPFRCSILCKLLVDKHWRGLPGKVLAYYKKRKLRL
jgi:hypothetical protein